MRLRSRRCVTADHTKKRWRSAKDSQAPTQARKTIIMPIETRKPDAEYPLAISPSAASPLSCEVEAALLTGGQDRHYAFGLAMSLIKAGVYLDVIGGDEVDVPEMHATTGLKYFGLRESQKRDAGFMEKAVRVLKYYARLVLYSASAKPKLFHILWNNKFEYFDRTVLMCYYKLLGKKVALTAHNINAKKRDLCDTWLNRLTLRVQYKMADCIFVHTEAMKREIVTEFEISEDAVTVIPYGINNAVPNTDLTPMEAKRRLGLRGGSKTILFFGAIAPYKGLDLLVDAFRHLATCDASYRLIIAGMLKEKGGDYLPGIQRTISDMDTPEQIIQEISYIPDDEMEIYFKAADLLVLPYREIFQSGVFFLGYSFGLPVVATDIGSFREDVVEGETGFLCRPNDPGDLAKSIEKYFTSELYRQLDIGRQNIQEYAKARHGWDEVAAITRGAYGDMLGLERRS